MNGSSSPTPSALGSPSASSKSSSAPAAATVATNGSSLGPIANVGANGGGGDLLDLDDIFGGGAEAAPAAAVPAAPAVGGLGVGVGAASGSAGTVGGAPVDLLADIFAASPGLATGGVGGGKGVTAVAVPEAQIEEDDFGGFEVAPPKDDTMVVRSENWDYLGRCFLFFTVNSRLFSRGTVMHEDGGFVFSSIGCVCGGLGGITSGA